MNRTTLLLALLATTLALPLRAADPLGSVQVRAFGLSIDVDARPDLPGVQASMTALRDVPVSLQTVLGAPGLANVPALPDGWRVVARLSGPSVAAGGVALSALPGGTFDLPLLRVAGSHTVSDVHLEDADGRRVQDRDPSLPAISIEVIDQLLVTEVQSRPLTADEIAERGIVVDDDNYDVMNFTVGFTVGGGTVTVELPVAIPSGDQGLAYVPEQAATGSGWQPAPSGFDDLGIPNLSVTGFQLNVPDEGDEERELNLPPINGVIIIPGNIAYLHQFFSVMLLATNTAPDGSGLQVLSTRARIALPAGQDGQADTGDDPLRLAETAAHGVQAELPLLDEAGSDTLAPQGTNQAEFLVEGLRQGTHVVTFDLEGSLQVPGLAAPVPLVGRAAGVVQVKDPTFSLVMAHPQVVREGEGYSAYVTVSNTSTTPANAFSLLLHPRSLSGCRLADGETPSRTLATLAPGASATFRFHLVALTTGKVGGTIFLADPGISGSFVLSLGVNDEGLPLSPDALILPQTTDYLPSTPDVVFGAVRLLGLGYSVATAPAGTLPPDVARISRKHVIDRAVRVAQAGLRVAFGEEPAAAAADLLFDMLGADRARLEDLVPDPTARAKAEADWQAFDHLRRSTDAGAFFVQTWTTWLAEQLATGSVDDLQVAWARAFASRPAHVSIGVQGTGAPLSLRLSDTAEHVLGRLAPGASLESSLPFAAHLPLQADGPSPAQVMVVAAPPDALRLELAAAEGAADVTLSLIVPSGTGGLRHAVFPGLHLPAGTLATLEWAADPDLPMLLQVDTDGDGTPELVPPTLVEAVVDEAPAVMGAMTWGKGARPTTQIDLGTGDPLGRLVGVVFDEAVQKSTAENTALYSIEAHTVQQAVLQADERLVFLWLAEPLGPFVPRLLNVAGVTDLADQPAPYDDTPVDADPEHGPAGVVTGQVLTADGRPIPYARVQYIQPVSCAPCNFGLGWVRDYGISTFTADGEGRFAIDFVLQDALVSDEGDAWLNSTNSVPTDHFKLGATDPETGDLGRASTRIHYDGQRLTTNVILRGYGAIDGRVLEADGTPAVGSDPDQGHTWWLVARNLSIGDSYSTWIDPQGGFAFPRTWTSPTGAVFQAPQVLVGNLTLQVVRPSDGYSGLVTVNVPTAGARVTRDLVLLPPTHYGTVTGRVLDDDGITPAAGVRVSLTGRVATGVGSGGTTFDKGLVGVGTTDGEGRFAFHGVPVGALTLRAFRQATYELVEASSFLAEGGQTVDVTLVLPGTGATVRGVVTDALGHRVAGARVVAGPAETATDASGSFELAALPLGPIVVWAQAPDSKALGSVELTLSASGEVQDVQIRLQALGSVEGAVVEADGVTPVKAQRVQLWTDGSGTQGVMAETFTDSLGRFHFSNYPTGTYSVRAVRANHGDGGMALTSLRFAGDVRQVVVRFRGVTSSIEGRVVQSNGTPAIADVVIGSTVWTIASGQSPYVDTSYQQYVDQLIGQLDEDTAAAVKAIYASTDAADKAGAQFFLLKEEPTISRSDVLGPHGEVTGRFRASTGATAGPLRVVAVGPFYEPSSKSLDVPPITSADAAVIDVGDLVLTPSVGEVRGTVFLPDGVTPVGADVRVQVDAAAPPPPLHVAGVVINRPGMPAYDVVTDEAGTFHLPLVRSGPLRLTADTGVPLEPATGPADAVTDRFVDDQGQAALNVRLYGTVAASVTAGATLQAGVRLHDAVAVDVTVVESDGVTPVPDAIVDLTTKAAQDVDEEKARATSPPADALGQLRFFPVTEGAFSVVARRPASPEAGRAEGEVPQDPANGTVLAIKVTLGAVTNADGQVQASGFFGAVGGTVLRPDGIPSDTPCEVRLTSGSLSLLTTTDAGGAYRFESVPQGAFGVEALELLTARRGVGQGSITSDGQVVELPLHLQGLGSVSGHVSDAAGASAVAGANLTLTPTGTFTQALVARADQVGAFSFAGAVPVGAFRLDALDAASGLTGSTTGRVQQDGDAVVADVRLEPWGQIEGVVYAPGVLLDADGQPRHPDGTPWPDAPGSALAAVTLEGGGVVREVQAGPDGRFESGPYLRLDTYRLTARAFLGSDGAMAQVTLSLNGQIASTSLVLAGQGRVEGVVLDSLGAKVVEGVRVTLSSASPYLAGSRVATTGVDGLFAFDAIPVGAFSLHAVTTLGLPILAASATGQVEAPGDLVAFYDGDAEALYDALRLQAAGSIRGVVLLPGGLTAADGAVVELRGPAAWLATPTDADGRFEFASLPLGEYALAFSHLASDGLQQASAELTVNGQELDLGDVILDGAPPVVVAIEPPDGSVGAPPAGDVTITFSEPLALASVTADTVVVSVRGVVAPGSLRVTDAPSRVVFTPDAPFADLTRVDVRLVGERRSLEGVVLSEGLADLAGRSLAGDVTFSYSTGDTLPPVLVRIDPADGSVDVAPASVVRFEFSEPIDEASVRALGLDCGAGPVAGTRNATPIQGGRVVVFAPDAGLAPNRTCTATLTGPVTDLAGNAMAQPLLTTTFATLDTLGPDVLALTPEPGAALVSGRTIRLTADTGAATDVAEVRFSHLGTVLATDQAAPWTHDLVLLPEYGASVDVQARASDRVGNVGAAATLHLAIAPNQPPEVALQAPAPGAVDQGASVVVRLSASDDVGLARVRFVASGGVSAGAEHALAGQESAEADFAFTVPASTAPGATIDVRAFATDLPGVEAATAPVRLTVRDATPPTLFVGSPADGAGFDPGADVAVHLRADDASGVASLALTATGAVTATLTHQVSPVASPALAELHLTVPVGAAPWATFTLAASALDAAGNRANATLGLHVNDVVPPHVLALSPAPGAVDVPRTATLRADLDEALDPATLNGVTVHLEGPSGPVEGALLAEPDQGTIRFAPAAPLEPGGAYTWTLERDVADPSGNRLAAAVTVPFTVEPAPAIAAIEPDHAGQGKTTRVTLTGSHLHDAERVDVAGTGVTATIVTSTDGALTLSVQVGETAATGQRSLVLVAAAGQASGLLRVTPAEVCTDLVDNDEDGATDCADARCDGTPACPELCANDHDDDGDGATDCHDADCKADAACVEDCTNAVDEDDDGLTDCADPDCAADAACTAPAGARSCERIRRLRPHAVSGFYTIDPDGPAGALEPFQAWCDLSTRGGGWTLVTVRDDGQPVTATTAAIGPDDGALALTSARWKALRALSSTLLVAWDAPSGGSATTPIAWWNNAACTPLGEDLTAPTLAHHEGAGCACVDGAASVLFGCGDGAVSTTLAEYEAGSWFTGLPSLRFTPPTARLYAGGTVEICDDGVDDDDDGRADCDDPDCDLFAGCLAPCPADVQFDCSQMFKSYSLSALPDRISTYPGVLDDASGPELGFEIAFAADTTVGVEIMGGVVRKLLLLDELCHTDAVLASGTLMLNFLAEAGRTYHLVLEGQPGFLDNIGVHLISCSTALRETSCSDGRDNDGDGQLDCADGDCFEKPGCGAGCDNGLDDDGDGWRDCKDPDCGGSAPCPEICNDFVDNDGDGASDCADPQCGAFVWKEGTCSNAHDQPIATTIDSSVTFGCYQQHGDTPQLETCIQAGTGLYQPCAASFADLTVCVAANCLGGCAPTDKVCLLACADVACTAILTEQGSWCRWELSCTNGVTDDKDSAIDCADPDCFGDPACP